MTDGNRIDHDDDHTLAPLDRAAASLRAQAEHHAGDLGDLQVRARHRRRVRGAITSVGIVVVGLVLAVGMVRAANRAEQVETPAGTVPATSDGFASVPRWTVNPSIDRKGDEMWAVEIRYDPTQWSFRRFTQDPSLFGVYGMATYHNEPIVNAYFPGPDGRARADAVVDAFAGQPGIHSAEIGLATPIDGPPGTAPIGPASSGTTP